MFRLGFAQKANQRLQVNELTSSEPTRSYRMITSLRYRKGGAHGGSMNLWRYMSRVLRCLFDHLDGTYRRMSEIRMERPSTQ